MHQIKHCLTQTLYSARSTFLTLLSSSALLTSVSVHSAEAIISSSEPVRSELAVEECLMTQVLLEVNLNRTIADIRDLCTARLAAAASSLNTGLLIESESQPPARGRGFSYEAGGQRFFQPYKNNYIVFGGMKNEDQTPAFSGNNLDIKFELGMMFSLIPSSTSETGFVPLHFGYSQRSWWDISEPSAPFREHNYNPEIFWEFSRSRLNTYPSMLDLRRLFFVDRIGVEHQSNGLNSEESRSWDRAYMEREFVFSEALSFNLKLWRVLSNGLYNEDITDFLGDGQLTAHITLNNMFNIDIKTMRGNETEKFSYQVDLTLPMSQWVNSKFFLSYYEGYGEALINYNQRSKSLRAGFYFPLQLIW
jgi:phospholipase A1/A2